MICVTNITIVRLFSSFLISFHFRLPFFFLVFNSNQVPSFVRTLTLNLLLKRVSLLLWTGFVEMTFHPLFFFVIFEWISLIVEIVRIIERILRKIRSVFLFSVYFKVYKKYVYFICDWIDRSIVFIIILVSYLRDDDNRRWRRRKWQKLCSTESGKNGRNGEGWYFAPFCSGHQATP